jgi:hypothetical protein
MKYPVESRKCHKHFDLYEFGYYLLDKFFAHYKDHQRGGALVCDLLFYKTIREAQEIQDGYA